MKSADMTEADPTPIQRRILTKDMFYVFAFLSRTYPSGDWSTISQLSTRAWSKSVVVIFGFDVVVGVVREPSIMIRGRPSLAYPPGRPSVEKRIEGIQAATSF